jgi:DNA-binding response OmpR family regulator
MEEIARPILLIEDYTDRAHSIKKAIQKSGMQCHLGTVVDNSELPLTCQAAGAVRPDILLLDLRGFKGGASDVLNEIGKEPHLRRTPLVILVDSAADSQISKDHDLHGYWRLSKPVDSEQCVTALKSLLRLWKAIVELSPQRSPKDTSTDTRGSGPKVGDGARTGIGRKIDWEGLCKEINE